MMTLAVKRTQHAYRLIQNKNQKNQKKNQNILDPNKWITEFTATQWNLIESSVHCTKANSVNYTQTQTKCLSRVASNTISKNSYKTVPPEYSQSDSVVNNIISHIFFPSRREEILLCWWSKAKTKATNVMRRAKLSPLSLNPIESQLNKAGRERKKQKKTRARQEKEWRAFLHLQLITNSFSVKVKPACSFR